MDAGTRLLVIPDRDAAEQAAEDIAEAGLATAPPRVVREALAGEDDAEDAQWVVVLEAPSRGWSAALLAQLDRIAADHSGWVERLETED
ncbi:MAG: hypothetical protein ACRD0P_03635 [Stackebrandtia sp.]